MKIVVTGGSSGIGAAVVELLSQNHEVTVVDINDPDRAFQFVQADITNGKGVAKAFEEIGPIDCLIHCAGIYIQKHLVDMSDEDVNRQITVNLTGTTLVNKYALKHMRTKGVIINISSALGIVPEPDSPIYCATKAGINMLTKALAQEYAGKGIRVNAVLPGPVDTPLLRKAFSSDEEFKEYEGTNPLGRIAQPDEVAQLVEYLVSEKSGFITGACIPIDGGESSSSLYSPVRK